MLFFAHLGITLGAALGLSQIATLKHKTSPATVEGNTANPAGNNNQVELKSRFGMGIVEIIVCAIGSLLPDIIDKPIGHYLFGRTFGYNGRIFSHTILFLAVILAIGCFFYFWKKQSWGLYLTFGVFMHLVLDFMWNTPRTLFWPLYGWGFPKSLEYDWLGSIFHNLFHNPQDYITEIFGFIVMVGVLIILFSYMRHQKRVSSKGKK